MTVEEVRDVQQTTCCVVGGGPGGMLLAFLLARRGVPVTLLEAHHDFRRDFRGDTLHPAILEILHEMGLAERLHQLPHVKLQGLTVLSPEGILTPVDFRRLKTRFPHIMLIPQEDFLDFLAVEAGKLPNFRLVMGANVQRLVEEGGAVRGVRYRTGDDWHEVRAVLTVGADGRFSRVRHLAGLKAVPVSPPFTLLWFRLPRLPDDKTAFPAATPAANGPPAYLATLPLPRAGLRIEGWGSGFPEPWLGVHGRGYRGQLLGAFDRLKHWQVGYFLRDKDQFQTLRAAGIEAFRRAVVELEPRFARNVEHLTDWEQLAPSLLTVQNSRCRRWYRDGLLLIGDAAHTMTPAAGAGIKYAIEDAVVAANVLAEPLLRGRVRLSELAEVQRRREWPTRFIQWFGGNAQKTFIGRLLARRGNFRLPPAFRLAGIPHLRDLFPRLIAFGLWRVHVEG